ncbi:MAG: universal stress protein [Thermoplasmatota archaeon]
MEEYNKILIPTDGSEANDVAVENGLSLARLLGAKATIFFVVDTSTFKGIPPDEMITDVTSRMETIGDKVLGEIMDRAEEMGVDAEKSIVMGHPAEEIIEESKNHDLVVIGTHGRSGLSKLLLGSTAEKVLRHSKCPVMLIKIKDE